MRFGSSLEEFMDSRSEGIVPFRAVPRYHDLLSLVRRQQRQGAERSLRIEQSAVEQGVVGSGQTGDVLSAIATHIVSEGEAQAFRLLHTPKLQFQGFAAGVEAANGDLQWSGL